MSLVVVVVLLPLLLTRAFAASVPNASSCSPVCHSLYATSPRARFAGCFSKLVIFGDSLLDSGNFAHLIPAYAPKTPYGITWPGYAKGRFSDGHTFADYYAEAFELEYAKPWQSCPCGTNFAIAGATALSVPELEARGFKPVVPFSLADELKWYQQYKASRCEGDHRTALYFVEIGGNDYTVVASSGLSVAKTIEEIVPLVIERIIRTVQLLLDEGVKNIIVENIPQSSCTPLYKARFKQTDEFQDECLVQHGEVIEAHNHMLQTQLFCRLKVPSCATVAIADRYSEFFEIWNRWEGYGFVNRGSACCGGPGGVPVCGGTMGSSNCLHPRRSVYWDYVHFTDEFNRIAVDMFLSGRFITSKFGGNVFRGICNNNQ